MRACANRVYLGSEDATTGEAAQHSGEVGSMASADGNAATLAAVSDGEWLQKICDFIVAAVSDGAWLQKICECIVAAVSDGEWLQRIGDFVVAADSDGEW